jgi:cellulose biosynthesis protein BcsQ
MAVANVAWILASNGKRVLAIDWDFEAPGLHRYLHPFLKDKELTSSRGLIDFFVEFSAAARVVRTSKNTDPNWYESYANLLPYAYSLSWDFPRDTETEKPGTLDFVPAGQQGPSYAVNVTSFDWRAFYEELGGGVFLEAMKQKLRAEYDYILIDSRTGITDTAGICTVQMPDDIVLCFTLNQQSMKGAAAVAESATAQRLRGTGEPSVRVWPVPTRVELNEKDRLDAALDLARSTFQRYIGHLTRAERLSYWGSVQVLYQPYFAYEEVLATFANRRRQTTSILSSMEAITGYLHGSPMSLGPMSEPMRLQGLELFKPVEPKRAASPVLGSEVFISYPSSARGTVERFVEALKTESLRVHWDGNLRPGDSFDDSLSTWLRQSDTVIYFVGSRIGDSQYAEMKEALERNIRIAPVVLGNDAHLLPPDLRRVHATFVEPDSVDAAAVAFARQIAELASTRTRGAAVPATPVDADDPQKGQWGSLPSRNGRTLSASVSEVSSGWFQIDLRVTGLASALPLTEPVEFHLHPTFPQREVTVSPEGNVAALSVHAWGAFTVGASADGGRTLLELDLSDDPSFPSSFRER